MDEKEINIINNFSPALSLVLDKLSPQAYRDAWVKHCRPLGTVKTAQKYNMIKSTVYSIFGRDKKKSDEK